MSTISAIILTYKKDYCWPIFLRSLTAQTRQPDQVIIVDDASPDSMRRHLRTLPSQWVKVILPRNGGQSNARNIGASRAWGDYILFLDGDVEMKPEMVGTQAWHLDTFPAASFAYCHYERVGTRQGTVWSRPWDPQALREANYVSTMSMVRRAHLPVPPFDPSLRMYEDWDLWLTMMERGRHGVLVDRVLFTAHYRHSDVSGMGESQRWGERVRRKHRLP